MVKAILTVDDIASKNTCALVDYLESRGIRALMFAVGENVVKFRDEALHALKKGMIVGNHSFSHPFFSRIPFEKGIEEIEKCEEILDGLYREAGVERVFRPFRFPYGDKGGENKAKYQEYFRARGFHKLRDTQIGFSWWQESDLKDNMDTYWTFDFEEYRIREGSGFTKEDVFRKINDATPKEGASLLEDGSNHILLLHAHDETEELVPEYYREFIDCLLEKGIQFENPQFV